jgi:hypothetical protein
MIERYLVDKIACFSVYAMAMLIESPAPYIFYVQPSYELGQSRYRYFATLQYQSNSLEHWIVLIISVDDKTALRGETCEKESRAG